MPIRESGAILQYLVDKYDPTHKISVSGIEEKYTQLQWVFFQSSGQGPYFGQVAWFLFYHPEKVPSAVERYRGETKRVLGVLESVLSKQEWLVGGKATIADISFISYVYLRAPLVIQHTELIVAGGTTLLLALCWRTSTLTRSSLPLLRKFLYML